MSKNVQITRKQPYCKVCHDAGKPEKDYTSHWVKDLTGKTLCPTLLNTECRYCFKLGHTAKFCGVLAKNNKEKEKRQVPTKEVRDIPPKKPTNAFSLLQEDSDSEVEEEVIENFPALNSGKVTGPALTGWAAIAAKPKEVVVTIPKVVVESEKAREPIPAPSTYVRDLTKPIYTKSWADWTDSDDDDDEEEEKKEEPKESFTSKWNPISLQINDDDW